MKLKLKLNTVIYIKTRTNYSEKLTNKKKKQAKIQSEKHIYRLETKFRINLSRIQRDKQTDRKNRQYVT